MILGLRSKTKQLDAISSAILMAINLATFTFEFGLASFVQVLLDISFMDPYIYDTLICERVGNSGHS